MSTMHEEIAAPLAPGILAILVEARGFDTALGEVVYFIRAESGRVKIGTTVSLHRRVKQLRAMSATPLAVLGTVHGGRHLERLLHITFATLRWGKSEWFEPHPTLLAFIKEFCQ